MQDFLVGRVGHSVFPIVQFRFDLPWELDSTRCDQELVCMHACGQSCLSLYNPMHGNPPGSCPGHFPGKNTGVHCQFLPPRDLSDPGWNPCLLYWQVGFYHTEPPGSPRAHMPHASPCCKELKIPGAAIKTCTAK